MAVTRYRWGAQVLAELHSAAGSKFVTLSRRLGIADGVLRQTLDHLMAVGWVQRNPGYGHPWRPEYILTEGGEPIGERCLSLVAEIGKEEAPIDLYSRWALPVIFLLGQGATRNADLKRELGSITPRALSQALKELQTGEMLERRVSDGFPPGVQYRLTDKGCSLSGVLDDF